MKEENNSEFAYDRLTQYLMISLSKHGISASKFKSLTGFPDAYISIMKRAQYEKIPQNAWDFLRKIYDQQAFRKIVSLEINMQYQPTAGKNIDKSVKKKMSRQKSSKNNQEVKAFDETRFEDMKIKTTKENTSNPMAELDVSEMTVGEAVEVLRKAGAKIFIELK